MKYKPTEAVVEQIVAISIDAKSINLRVKITNGPTALLDKRVSVILSPKDVEQIVNMQRTKT